MKKLALFALAFLAMPQMLYATDRIWHSGELIDTVSKNPGMDGRPIILEGEIISEPIERFDGCWVNVTDGSISIGVFFKDCSQTESVKFWGGTQVKGDLVRITGKVYKADKETNGELDVQGETLSIVESGFHDPEHVPPWKIWVAIIFGIIALALVAERFSSYLKTRKTRNQNLFEGLIQGDSDISR